MIGPTKALFTALSQNDEKRALECLQQGALMKQGIFVETTVRAGDVGGITALHMAAKRGMTAVVQVLLDKGHDVHSCNTLGWTPMHEAAYAGHLNIVKLLHQRRANISVKTDKGASVLLLAVMQDKFDVGIYALEATKGALLYEADLQHNTPFHMATILQRTAFLEYFLQHYYVKDLLNTPGMDGDLPLHALVTADPESPFIAKFIEQGANPRLVNKEKERPSQLAQRYRVTNKLLREQEFPLFYLCAKKIVQDPDLHSQAKQVLPELLTVCLDNVKKEVDDLSAQMSKLKFDT